MKIPNIEAEFKNEWYRFRSENSNITIIEIYISKWYLRLNLFNFVLFIWYRRVEKELNK